MTGWSSGRRVHLWWRCGGRGWARRAGTPARLSGSAFASLRQWAFSGPRPASGAPASQNLLGALNAAPSYLASLPWYTQTTHRAMQHANKDQASLPRSCVSRLGPLIGCHPQQSCPGRSHPKYSSISSRVSRALERAEVQVPTVCPSQLMGTPFPWPIFRLAREPTSHHAQTSRQKGYIEEVGGAGILQSGLPSSEWRPATQGFGPTIRHINVQCSTDREVTFARYPMH